MRRNNWTEANLFTLLGLGAVGISLAILATLETPKDLLRKRANQLFWFGVGTGLFSTGIDAYLRKKAEKLTEDTPWSDEPEFWKTLEQEVFPTNRTIAKKLEDKPTQNHPTMYPFNELN